jgi:hypothetical protein
MKDSKPDDGNPKFGRLLIVLFIAVIVAGLLTWIMGTYFPDFGLPASMVPAAT